MKLTCNKPFEIVTQKVNGVLTDINAEIGDVIEVKSRNFDYFYITAIHKPTGKINIYSTWQRKEWVKGHCS